MSVFQHMALESLNEDGMLNGMCLGDEQEHHVQ